jgi:protein N-terminal methyltransferase
MADRHNSSWFLKSLQFWENVDPTTGGMLGGLENLASIDERDSTQFIEGIIPSERRLLALDCGAGIGRVSQKVLLKIFKRVSLLECTAKFLEEARQLIPSARIFHLHNSKIQDIFPNADETGAYDLVWFQWVLCYASDDEVVQILKNASKFLKSGGLIGIKENITLHKDYAFDDGDHSMTRSDICFKHLFALSGLEMVSTTRQRNFPKSLYPVKMHMLRPIQ